MTARITLLDGGMGRELKRRGAPFRQPEWSALALMEAPETVERAHAAFIAAGAEVITTNSYALVPFHIGAARFATDGQALAGPVRAHGGDGFADGGRVMGEVVDEQDSVGLEEDVHSPPDAFEVQERGGDFRRVDALFVRDDDRGEGVLPVVAAIERRSEFAPLAAAMVHGEALKLAFLRAFFDAPIGGFVEAVGDDLRKGVLAQGGGARRVGAEDEPAGGGDLAEHEPKRGLDLLDVSIDVGMVEFE